MLSPKQAKEAIIAVCGIQGQGNPEDVITIIHAKGCGSVNAVMSILRHSNFGSHGYWNTERGNLDSEDREALRRLWSLK